ncbi:MAG: 50S ribosomal protein L21 [Candidatus Moraniibacteriota bacterium]
MIAVIKTGGKQYKVAEGDVVKVEKLEAEVDNILKFETLFTGDETSVAIGTPALKTHVEGKVVAHGRHAKVTGIRHKAKKREMTRYGHRQDYTAVEITKITA